MKYAYRDRINLVGLENIECLKSVNEFIQLKKLLEAGFTKGRRLCKISLTHSAKISIRGTDRYATCKCVTVTW